MKTVDVPLPDADRTARSAIHDLGAAAWSAIYLGVAAATLPAVLPVMVGVLADDLKFGTVKAGYVASANLGAIALGSVICAAAVRRSSWQSLVKIGALIMIGTNLLTMLARSFPVFALLRFSSGFGEGLIAAICYAAMSRSRQPARSLAFYVAGQGLAGALGMGLIPGIVATAGWPWLFVIVSAVALPAFWLAKPIGTLRGDVGQSAGSVKGAGWVSWTALLCILIYFIGMSAVWALSERIGHGKGIEVGHLSIALSASAIANMAGSLSVGVLAHRIGTPVGLAVGVALALLGLYLMAVAGDWRIYLAAVSLFFFAWGVSYPFQFRMLSNADKTGGMAVLIPLVTGGAFAVGPAVGGHLLADGGAILVCGFGAACILVSTAASAQLHFKSAGAIP